jgi:hypothetical protein
MKSFFAFALAAVAFADEAADKSADATAKSTAAGKHGHGETLTLSTDVTLSNAIAQPDITLTTGGTSRGTLKTWTGWHRTTGTDSQLYFDFAYQIVPTGDY